MVGLEDPRRLGHVSNFLSIQFYRMGSYGQAISAAQQVLALTTSGGEVVLHALANLRLGLAYHAQGEYRWAIDAFNEVMASIGGARRRERFGQIVMPAVHASAVPAWCHAELGMFAEGRVLGAEELRIAEVVDHPASLMVVSWGSVC